MSVLIEHFAAATAALMAGRREGGVMADAPRDRNHETATARIGRRRAGNAA